MSGSTPHAREGAQLAGLQGRILSGIQPTGNLHLGNYLGAIRNWVALQKNFECLFCIVDLHAITVWQEPKELMRSTREVAAGMIAAGIDPPSMRCSCKAMCPPTPSSPGCSTASRAWAGSIA